MKEYADFISEEDRMMIATIRDFVKEEILPVRQQLDEDEDSDHDGMPDVWEIKYGLDPLDANDADGDKDEDGLSNREEYDEGTDPTNPDSDDDGWEDGKEIDKGTSPLDPDDHDLDPSVGIVW